jgi:hypothetical protein
LIEHAGQVAHEVGLVEQGFGKGRCPQSHRRGHGQLHVGAPGHGEPLMVFGECCQSFGQLGGPPRHDHCELAHPQAQCGEDLVVAGAAGVDFLTDLALFAGQVCFDGGMAILILHGDGKCPSSIEIDDRTQTCFECFKFRNAQESGPLEGAGMSDGSQTIGSDQIHVHQPIVRYGEPLQ